MPRPSRQDTPGSILHVFARGVEKRVIFLDENDFQRWDALTWSLSRKFEVEILAWAWMINHIHMVLRRRNGRMSEFMQALLGSYARYFNDRLGRVGHLWQDRYGSKVIDSSTYFLHVLRYVNGNPLKDGVVAGTTELAAFPWSGHREMVRRIAPYSRSMLSAARILNLKNDEFQRAYVASFEKCANWYADDDGVFLGFGGPDSPDRQGFVKQTLDLLITRAEWNNPGAQAMILGPSKSREAVTRRAHFAVLATSGRGLSYAEVAHYLGRTPQAVASLVKSRAARSSPEATI